MKQQITIEQLNELSDKAKEKLRAWCNSKCKPIPGSSYILPGDSDVIMADFMTIGQCIEYLDENIKHTQKDLLSDTFFWSGKGKRGYVTIDWTQYDDNRGQLIDALWEAVKEDLEK